MTGYIRFIEGDDLPLYVKGEDTVWMKVIPILEKEYEEMKVYFEKEAKYAMEKSSNEDEKGVPYKDVNVIYLKTSRGCFKIHLK